MSKDSRQAKEEKRDPEAATGDPGETEPREPEAGESSPEKPSGGEEVGELLRKLDQATEEVTRHKERYLRTVADLENYRKRALREKEEARRQANFSLAEDLLPVLDNFKLGLQSAMAHEGGEVFAEGFRMILGQMEAALRQNGLEEINPENSPFDPNYHEAVSHIPHETVADGHVVEVQRIGYLLHGRLLRPAAVVISSGTPGNKADEEPGSGEGNGG